MSSFESPSESQAPLESAEAWYEKAKVKAESFVSKLHPDLHVAVEHVRVKRLDSGRPYETLSLRFVSPSDPALDWNLEIEMSDEYINERLEAVVGGLYQKHSISLRR